VKENNIQGPNYKNILWLLSRLS